MKEAFIEWNPQQDSLVLLSDINNILTEYKEEGYKLTVRQLYYQLVAGDIIPNNINQYQKITQIIGKARMSGMIDWDMIEDRVRVPSKNTHWDDPEQILQACISSYYKTRWVNQDYYVEVWCEKDAVSNIIEPVCRKWDVLFMANRGYSSLSAMYEAYQRFADAIEDGKAVTVIYVGDHDPSGMDMTRDIRERLTTFLSKDEHVNIMPVSRAALNMDQIEEHEPPENPAKKIDPRYKTYAEQYGDSSWELDALKPDVLSGIIEDSILDFLDEDEFQREADKEEREKDTLRDIAARFEDGEFDIHED